MPGVVAGQAPAPRHSRGVRHRLNGALAVALGATLAGTHSCTAIADWAAGAAPAELGGVPGSTLIGAWMWLHTSVTDDRRVVAFKGTHRAARGARPET